MPISPPFPFRWSGGACYVGDLCVGAVRYHGDGLFMPLASCNIHLPAVVSDDAARAAVEREATRILNQVIAGRTQPVADPTVTRMLDVTCPHCSRGFSYDIGAGEPGFMAMLNALRSLRSIATQALGSIDGVQQ